MPVRWGDTEDAILAGDLAAVLAYTTPAGGAVPAAVAPIGMRDRDRGTVDFTTSLGFGRKLARIRADPRVALAYDAREHGFAADPSFVLVQGTATFDEAPDEQVLEQVVQPASERFMGKPRRGLFWDRWLREYYADRVIVRVTVDRVSTWPDATCRGEPVRVGAEAPAGPPSPQAPPAKGEGPRVPVAKAAARLRGLPHVLIAFTGADGYPVLVPVTVGADGPDGLRLRAAPGLLPPGGRRAGLLGHRFNAQLIGLESRQHTGWLTVGDDGEAIYAPHTYNGFAAPANKTLLLLGNGLMAKQGLRRARNAAAHGG